MEWDVEKQARLDVLHAAELTDNLDEADEAELKALLELIEAEERGRLAPALAQMREEQAVLRQQVQESEVANEQLASLAAQQEQWLADARRLLQDLQRRYQAMKETYQSNTDEPMAVA